MTEYTTSIDLDGKPYPALAKGPEPWRWALVPLENGWVAYVFAFARPDETEYCLGLATPSEAAEIIGAHEHDSESELRVQSDQSMPLWVGSTWRRRRIKWTHFPRGDWDLIEDLRDLSVLPMPEELASGR